MDMELNHGKMELLIRVNIVKAKRKVKASLTGQMAVFMKAIFSKTIFMAMVIINGMMEESI